MLRFQEVSPRETQQPLLIVWKLAEILDARAVDHACDLDAVIAGERSVVDRIPVLAQWSPVDRARRSSFPFAD